MEDIHKIAETLDVFEIMDLTEALQVRIESKLNTGRLYSERQRKCIKDASEALKDAHQNLKQF